MLLREFKPNALFSYVRVLTTVSLAMPSSSMEKSMSVKLLFLKKNLLAMSLKMPKAVLRE